MTPPSIECVVIVCGDRNWKDRTPIATLISTFPPYAQSIVITGGAAGADTIAWECARAFGHRNVRMDAPWEPLGKRAGPARNQWMLDLLRDLAEVNRLPAAATHVHAFHDHIASSKGTADMISRARAASIPYTIHNSTHD